MRRRFFRGDWCHAFDGLRRDAKAVGLSASETARLVRDAEVMIREALSSGVPADRLEVLFVSERAGHGRLLVGDGVGCVAPRFAGPASSDTVH